MRHIRTRRYYKIVLFFLFVLCVTLYAESRIEALVPELKAFAEAKVERAFGNKIKLSIGAVDGGILQPITLNDVKIEQVKAAAFLESLVINNIRINNRVWDFLKMKKTPQVSDLLEKNSALYVNFSLKKGDIKGFVGIEGDLEKSKLAGYVVFPGNEKFEFTGTVRGDTFNVSIRSKTGEIQLRGSVSDSGEVSIRFETGHIKSHGIDVACNGTARVRVIRTGTTPADTRVEGELDTTGLFVNYKPLPEVKARFSISNNVLSISGLSLGDDIKLYGDVSLKRPNAVDVTLTANNVSLTWLLQQFGMKDPGSMATGTLNGKFILKGFVNKLNLESVFEIRKGTISTLDYDNLNAHLKGDLPFLKIEEARMTRKSGYLALGGEINVSKIGKDVFFKDVKLITDDNAISWDEWGSVKRQGVEEVTMAKNLTSDIGLQYKKFVTNQKIDESTRDGDEVKLEYKLNAHDSLGVSMGQDKDFFGFEHKDKF